MGSSPSLVAQFAKLQQAYATTRYVAQLDESGPFTLRPDHRNARLDAWMQTLGVASLHVVTACNPRSQISSAAWNQQAMLDLKKQLHTLGWDHWRGCNQAIADDWPEEESFIVSERSQDDVLDLAEQLGQYAVLKHPIGQASRLIYTSLFFADNAQAIADR